MYYSYDLTTHIIANLYYRVIMNDQKQPIRCTITYLYIYISMYKASKDRHRQWAKEEPTLITIHSSIQSHRRDLFKFTFLTTHLFNIYILTNWNKRLFKFNGAAIFFLACHLRSLANGRDCCRQGVVQVCRAPFSRTDIWRWANEATVGGGHWASALQ